jgi:hypothetical protein
LPHQEVVAVAIAVAIRVGAGIGAEITPPLGEIGGVDRAVAVEVAGDRGRRDGAVDDEAVAGGELAAEEELE